MNKRVVPIIALAFALAGCSVEVEDTGPGQPVAHRRAAFKEILKVFEPMGVMLRTDTYEPQRFARLANALEHLRDGPWPYFQPDTNYPPTKAKAAVWSDQAAFEEDRKAFFKATDHLIEVAGTADKNVAKTAYKAVEDACYACHKEFKNR